MKKAAQFLLAGTLFSIILLSSCAKDDPEPTTPAGSDPRTNFHGHWYVSETSSSSGPATYYTDITDSSDASFILFSYLYGYHTKVRATVSGNNLTIPSQVVEGNNISGTGTLTNLNRLNLHYLVWLGGANYDTVTAVLTK